MTYTTRQFKKAAEHLHLSAAEKQQGREALFRHMQLHAVRNGKENRQSIQSQHTVFTSILSLIRSPMIASLLIALTLIASGGISYAAESSLPGDTLYPVKIHVNEEVRSALAVNDKDQAEWDAARAERRLAEAATLAAKGQLKADTQTQIATNFENFADRVSERVQKLEAAGETEKAAEVSSRFEAALKAHEKILTSLSLRADDLKRLKDEIEDRDEDHATSTLAVSSTLGIDPKILLPLLNKVKLEIKSNTEVREDAEKKIQEVVKERAQEAAEGRMTAARNKLDEVNKFLVSVKDRANAETYKKANERLTEAEKRFAEGRKSIDEKKYSEAFIRFNEAHAMAQEAKLLVDLSVKLDLDEDVFKVGKIEVKNENKLETIIDGKKIKIETHIEDDGRQKTEVEIEPQEEKEIKIENRGSGSFKLNF